MVKRTQVYLDEWIYETLRREAFQQKTSLSAMLRKILAEKFAKKKKKGPQGLMKIVGLFRDRASDVSEKHDDYLAGIKK